jgi:hypothetical protein
VVTSIELNTGTPQPSVTVGVVHIGVAEHWIVVGPGNPERTGGVMSTVLVISCVQVFVFPQTSVAIYVLVVVSTQPTVEGTSLT